MGLSRHISRRSFLKTSAAGMIAPTIVSANIFNNSEKKLMSKDIYTVIRKKIFETPLIDTHEHFPNESDRLKGIPMTLEKANDWSVLFNHYADSDLLSAGMPKESYYNFFSNIDPLKKWEILKPYWPLIKNTGYGQVIQYTLRELYDIDELNTSSIKLLNDSYRNLIKPGFYKSILQKKGNILSCQVNRWPYLKSELPDFLMSDLDVTDMFHNPGTEMYAEQANINPNTLNNWHRIIDWWFENYGRNSVAFKTTSGYRRRLDFEKTEAETVNKIYSRMINREELKSGERKQLEDHLFWYVIGKIKEINKPLKIHTGYHAQWDGKDYQMSLYSVKENVADLFNICAQEPDVNFIALHIAYPYYEELLTLAKQYHNVYVDMVWSWIINPIASKDFFKKFIVTVPNNKLLPFGGDYFSVELAFGSSVFTREIVAKAFTELIDEGYISINDSMNLIENIFHKNAQKLFKI